MTAHARRWPRTVRRLVAGVTGLVVLGFLLVPGQVAAAGTVPSGFRDTVALSGLTNPTVVQFAADGRVFVAQKNGKIMVFDDLADTTPTLFADLSIAVHNFWDRGLLGMALDPAFTTGRTFVYVLYAYDAVPGGSAPRWGDTCPTPPGATTDGCLISGRLSKLVADGNVMTGAEQPLITDWCQQFPSHSVGTVLFGTDGALYAGAGDGASFNATDYGQFGANYAGDVANPCGDPPGGAGVALTPPSAAGGALRSQSVRRSSGPTTLDGSIIRVDPDTGAAMPGNPFAGSGDVNKQRVIAYGLRNPFRFASRPGTSELWVGDVGWNAWEEVDRVAATGDGVAENFGWPCYEGNSRQSGYDAANLTSCETLYNAGGVTAPVLAYNHSAQVVSGDGCPTANGSAIAGLAFYGGGNYPAAYDGALFFADHSRNCIWAMAQGSNGQPDPATVSAFDTGASGPVHLTTGPGGDIFYAGFEDGNVHRISYVGNAQPTAAFTATPASGTAPLSVSFDGSSSSDPEGGTLTYDWDLNGDATFGDSASVTPTWTYADPGNYTVTLKVTDPLGVSDTATRTITVTQGAANAAPVPSIATPTASVHWKVGDPVSFGGSASDAEDGALPASALSWTLVLQHCPSACHAHTIQTFDGVASGSFNTPDHQYPSYLELRLTATDSQGASATTSVRLDPQTVLLSFATSPTGLQVAVDARARRTPFTMRVIRGHSTSVSAPTPQWKGGNKYAFVSWSDGGAASHQISATAKATYTAQFRRVS